MYVEVNTLPSRFIPYNSQKLSIQVRPLKLKEVEQLSRVTSFDYPFLYNLFSNNQVIRCPNLLDLTIHDFDFLSLLICTYSFAEVSFRVSIACPNCSGKVEKIKVGFAEIDPSQIPATILPAEILFEELSSDIKPPIEVEFSFGKRKVDFIRLKHVIETNTSDFLEYPLLSKLIEGLTQEEYNSMSQEDEALILYLYNNLLYHGAKSSVSVKCPSCNTSITADVNWSALEFFPKVPSEDALRSKIRFSSDSPSTDSTSSGATVLRNTRTFGRIEKISNGAEE